MPAKSSADPYVSFLEAKLATEMGPYEAKEEADAGRAVLLDVRGADSWNEGHATGALHIPRRELETRLKELPKNKPIIAYCSDVTCQSSLKATIILRKAGFDARHMTGGYERWVHKGYPVEGAKTRPNVALARGH